MPADQNAASNELAIKSMVLSIQPPDTELRASMLQQLGPGGYCLAGNKHKWNVSLGKTNFDTIGIPFHVCIAGASQTCGLHKKPLRSRPSDEALLQLYRWLSELNPPPYKKSVNRASAIKLREQMRNRLDETVSTPSSQSTVAIPRTPSTARIGQGSSPAKSSQGSSAAKSSQGSSVGRPRNETVRVPVLVYMANGVEPVQLTVEGIVRDTLVEVVFKQADAWARLGLDPSSRDNTVDFHRWNWMLGEWSYYPRPHTVQFILPKETLLYREASVTRPWKLDHYTTELLPREFYDRLLALVESVGMDDLPAPLPSVAGPSSMLGYSTPSSSKPTPSKLAPLPFILAGKPQTPTKRAAEGRYASSSSAKRYKTEDSSQIGKRLAPPVLERRGTGKAPPPDAEIIELSDDEVDLDPKLKGHSDRKGKGKATDLDMSED
ncbi:hypothetical protein K466DRAFT_604561 [Polyporus arcularius HHB13444]|uniref:Uncharacterized protein n=1 Tax=Polyporus arcularius HHB13444 TaxID=1314778 RepID=A0A5C3NXV3_9APHY|nr:hypothetical protein K466DRAFT_604561 [Polyporus arcularius HHB13444]